MIRKRIREAISQTKVTKEGSDRGGLVENSSEISLRRQLRDLKLEGISEISSSIPGIQTQVCPYLFPQGALRPGWQQAAGAVFTFVPAADPSEVLVPGDRVSWRTDTATPRKLSCPPRLQLPGPVHGSPWMVGLLLNSFPNPISSLAASSPLEGSASCFEGVLESGPVHVECPTASSEPRFLHLNTK